VTKVARSGGRVSVLAMLCASGGILLGSMTAMLSPSVVLRSAAVMAPRALASPDQSAPRTAPAMGLAHMKLEDQQVGYYLAKPEGEGTWPGVLLLHEGWGLDEAFKKTADRFAGEGFFVVAPDLNGGKVARDADKARELSVIVDEAAAASILEKLAAYVKFMPEVGDHRIGVVGFDMGGRLALLAGMRSTDVSAVVVAYGRPITDRDQLRRIACPILGLFGERDELVPQAEVERFREALGAASRNAEVKVYPAAGRAFMNPQFGRFDEADAKDAWSRIVAFLKDKL
jgi:carboxymethylenebutenolidase